jgi:peroxiredoxin
VVPAVLSSVLLAAGAVSGQGSALLGTPSPDWPARQWVQGGPLQLSDLRGKVVLVRFFMDSECPLCRATAPALNALHEEFGPRGLVVVGLYTPKPRPRPTSLDEVRRYVEAYGFRFPVAVDDDWAALRRLWLDRVPGADFTSSSLLIDREGVVRHVHPGGAFAPDAKDERARRDHDALRAAVERALTAR